jgi:hypothetical protein
MQRSQLDEAAFLIMKTITPSRQYGVFAADEYWERLSDGGRDVYREAAWGSFEILRGNHTAERVRDYLEQLGEEYGEVRGGAIAYLENGGKLLADDLLDLSRDRPPS